MPRDGLQQYAPPPGTNGITNYTIESTKYNGFVADVTQDLNLPRPIVAGGTGANNAHDALINLHGEESGQLVTNYDTFPFVNGSFYSNGGATAAPNALNAFIGICYMHGNSDFMTLEARLIDAAPGVLYVRVKRAGVWGAWQQQAGSTADLDAAYVNVTGDTMTGPLVIQKDSTPLKWGLASNPTFFGTLTSDPSTGQTGIGILAEKIGSTWQNGPSSLQGSYIANGVGGYTLGAVINSVSTASAPFTTTLVGWGIKTDGSLAVPSAIASSSPTTGALTVAGGLGVAAGAYANFLVTTAHVQAGAGGATGIYYFGNQAAGNKYLQYDGSMFNLVGAGIVVPSLVSTSASVVSGNGGTTGTYYFGNTGTKYLAFDGVTTFSFSGGYLANSNRVGVLASIAGTTGYAYGVASVTDSGTGFCDVNFNFTFAGGANSTTPVACAAMTAVHLFTTLGVPGASSQRIHCVNPLTTALTDPFEYFLHVGGA